MSIVISPSPQVSSESIQPSNDIKTRYEGEGSEIILEHGEVDFLPIPPILAVIFLIILVTMGIVVYMKSGGSGPVGDDEE